MNTLPTRFYFLDNLKWFLTVLVICFHSMLACTNFGHWSFHIPAPANSIQALILMFFGIVVEMFFMSLFFAISSFFQVPSYDRKGGKHFLLDRCKRLGIPLLLFYFICKPSISYIVFLFKGQTSLSYFNFMMTEGFHHHGPGPLWFVEVLLIFATLYTFIRWLRPIKLLKKVETHPFPSHKKIALFIIAMTIIGIILGWLLSPQKKAIAIFVGHLPIETSLFFVAFYLLGTMAYRRKWFTKIDKHISQIWGMAALLAIAALSIFVFSTGNLLPTSIVGVVFFLFMQSVICVGVSLFLLYFFHNHCNYQPGLLANNLARAAFTAYVIHEFFVVSITALVAKLSVGPLLHFIVLAPTAVVLSFTAAHYIRQSPELLVKTYSGIKNKFISLEKVEG